VRGTHRKRDGDRVPHARMKLGRDPSTVPLKQPPRIAGRPQQGLNRVGLKQLAEPVRRNRKRFVGHRDERLAPGLRMPVGSATQPIA